MKNIFSKVIAPIHSDFKGEYCFYCSMRIFDRIKRHQPYPSNNLNCRGQRTGSNCKQSVSHLRTMYEKLTDEEVLDYLNKLVKNKIEGHKMPIKLLGYVKDYLQVNHSIFFDKRKKEAFFKLEAYNFFDYTPSLDVRNLKTSDIPFTNNKITKNAVFCTRLYFLFYHIENSLRKFLKNRLNSIYGHEWENKLNSIVDLHKAKRIKAEVNLSNLFPKRGDNILSYCMWEDYVKILRSIPQILNDEKKLNEFSSHLSSMTKIRNAIAHHAETVDSDTMKEMEVFVIKYIKMIN